MKSYLLLISLLVYSVSAFSHSPDLSTAALVESDKGYWIVQLNSALTAFEHEIHQLHSDSSYSSPEEFQALLAAHCRENFIIVANGADTIAYSNVAVRLGHATDVVFEIEAMPAKLVSLTVTNRIFKEIDSSKSVLLILKKNFPRIEVSLSEDNNFTQSFEIQDDRIVVTAPSMLGGFSKWALGVVGMLSVLVLLGRKSSIGRKSTSLDS